MDELRLIKRIQRDGDRDAADELIRRHYDTIHRFVKRQIQSDDIALNLTQETFISCLKTIAHYEPAKKTSFRTWLYKIASNKAVDYYRSRAYQETVKTLPLEEVEAIDEPDFALRLENRGFAEEVCTFVSGLPADTQKVFLLHIFGGHTFAQIAAAVGLPEGSVKSRYYRLISMLRKEFACYG